MDERSYTNEFPPLKGPNYSIPDSLSTILTTALSDKLVYLSNPSSYAALLGVSLSVVTPRDDGTVYTGKAGLALLYLKMGQLEQAKRLAEESLQTVSNSRVTFLTGSPGPLAILAVIANLQGQQVDLTQIVQMVDQVCQLPSSLPDELLYGRAGYLYTLLYLRQEISPACVPSGLVRRVVEAILKSGQTMAAEVQSRAPLMYAWHDKVYLGAAHGLAGVLAMLLQAREAITPAEMVELVRPTVDYLLSTAFKSGNFPSSKGNEKDRLVHWCHGAPGMVHLLLLAQAVWGGDTYLGAATRAGELIWARGLLRKGNGLCHGTAGNGYSLLALYQTTGEEVWLYRAACFASWCCRAEQSVADRPLSLFEGLAGTVCFLRDIGRPKEAKFPALII